GWDVWLEGNRVGTHIINKWSENALKIVARTPLKPNEWYHVTVTYDGSRKAAGAKIYLNGALQEYDVQADQLKDSIRTTVPFKVGQRNTSERLAGLVLENLRIYTRPLAATEIGPLARADRMLELAAKSAEQRTDAERNELSDFWLANL